MNRKEQQNIKNDFFLADWMSGKITDEELRELVSSEDFIAYKKILQAFESLERPTLDVKKAYNNFLAKAPLEKQPKVKRLLPNWAIAVAASVVLLFGVFQFLKLENTVTTDFGAKQTIVLNDGSSVTLNAKTRLTYAKSWNFNRDVFLEGEAFFKITKGDKFEVNTRFGSVSVLGTEFNVIARDDFFEVICYEGKVRVQRNGQETVLTPGIACRIVGNEDRKQWKTTQKTATWQSGVSSFNSVPVKVVFEALQNEYKVSIDLGKIDANRLFTGSFKHDNLETALASICVLLDVDYKIESSTKIILVNNKE